MTAITTRLVVASDGAISSEVALPPGEYVASVRAASEARKVFNMDDFPVRDDPWDGSISLRREDMYDDEGRLIG